jgi:uncharacterized protein involved in cysteine biosynthesis
LPVFEVTNWWSWIWIGPGRLVLWFLGWLGVLFALAIALLTALLSANVLSAPFLDRLSARVEAIEEGVSADREEGLAAMLRETGRSFAAEFQRLAFLAAVWVSLGLAGFVFPGAHLITGPLLVAATVLLLPLDYAGFALDRRGIPFRTRRRWLRENWPTMTAFGGVAFLSCLVPGLNLLVLPVFVTAGTLLVIRIRPRETNSDPGTSLV